MKEIKELYMNTPSFFKKKRGCYLVKSKIGTSLWIIDFDTPSFVGESFSWVLVGEGSGKLNTIDYCISRRFKAELLLQYSELASKISQIPEKEE